MLALVTKHHTISNLYNNVINKACEGRLIKIGQLKTGSRRVSKVRMTSNKNSTDKIYGRCELDTHADTTVAGSNCVVLQYTGKECDVTPYSDSYEPMQNIPIVHAATGWQSPVSGQIYILIFNEALWMGNTLDYTLINPNQLRHNGIQVQDNPMNDTPLSIINSDGEFGLELKREGTTIYTDTFSPTSAELEDNPKIILTSARPWNPQKVNFPQTKRSLEEVMGQIRSVSATSRAFKADPRQRDIEINVFNLNTIKRRISSMTMIQGDGDDNIMIRPDIDTGLSDVAELPTFESSDRHTDITPTNLSERWGISIQQAIKTLKKTTQRFLRSAVLPLGRRYRVDRMYTRKTLKGEWATDTIDARCKSLDGNKYAQVFANKKFFAKLYPMDTKSKAGDALKLFCSEFGVPEKLIMDGSKEQTGKHTTFMKKVRSEGIEYHIIEPGMHNQNPVEGVIGQIRRRWYRTMIRKQVPKQLWDYGMRWVTEIMCLTDTAAGDLHGNIPLTEVTGDTVDISEYLDFGFYDPIWFKDNAGLSPAEPGRWLGVADKTGRLMCYHILSSKGTVLPRSTVQRVTNLELQTTQVKDLFTTFDKNISIRLKDKDRTYQGSKPNPNDWSDLIENDQEFKDEFTRVFNNTDILEADDYTPDVLEDTYVNMEITLSRDGDGPQFGRVTKRLRDKNGLPIGTANDNPILDTRLYEVEFLDGYKASLAANTIAENLFSQVDEEGNRYTLFDVIEDHRTTGEELQQKDAFIISSNKGKRRRETTKGWEILLRWKDGSSSWETLKDVKQCYPLQLAEYALEKRILKEPAFAWWTPHVLKKKNRIISKAKTKYWQSTTKFGFRIPRTISEAQRIDNDNQNSYWMDAVRLEMKNVRIAFEVYDGDTSDLKDYQKIPCHMIFDIKMSDNFRRKARMVAGGHLTETPPTLTYSSVVSRDSIRILLMIAALNGLDVLSCDIQNAYLTAPCREKIWTIAGQEFGSEMGKPMLIVRALYGLKSSGAAFRSFLADHLWEMGYRPSQADPDVWMRAAVKVTGLKYWEYVLCYVDDILSISNNPNATMEAIKTKFKLKGDKTEPPKSYLGASLSKMINEDNEECWAISSDPYCDALVTQIESVLEKKGIRLLSRCGTPLKNGYEPELDVTAELKADGVQFYQELIGSLRWAVEIGRVDILLEVSNMSSQLALPREGHLEQVLHILGYLKEHKKLRLMMDSSYPDINEKWFKHYNWEDFYRDAKEAIPPKMPEPRGNYVTTSCFVDADLAGNKVTRRSQTGVLIFVNQAPIHYYSKKQPTVETSTFGAEFCAMKVAVEMIEALRYKLRMFGIPVGDGTNNSTAIFCDNQAVYQNTVVPESTLKKKHHSIAYHRCREAVAACTVKIAKQGTEKNLADLFTKKMTAIRRRFLLDRWTY